MDYEPWGAYLGTWASSVNTMTSDGEIEIRWLAGQICGHRVWLDGADGYERHGASTSGVFRWKSPGASRGLPIR